MTDQKMRHGMKFKRHTGIMRKYAEYVSQGTLEKKAQYLPVWNMRKETAVSLWIGDLQHPPETIIEMYHLWERGYEVIEGVKADSW